MGPDLQSSLRFGPPRVEVERRADGAILLRSPQKLGKHARAVGEWLERWARETPDRTFLAERSESAWRKLSYREALALARRTAQRLLDLRLHGPRPLLNLSGKSIDHPLLRRAAV